MPTEIKVPALGESITEGVIANWLVPVGGQVAVDQPIVELETDKITVEVPAPAAGVLARQAVEVGATVTIGQVLGVIDAAAAASAPEPEPETEPEPEPAQPAPSERQSASPPAPAKPAPSDRQSASPPAPAKPAPSDRQSAAPVMPAARAEAERSGVDLTRVDGSGRGGRILKEDVQRAGQAADPGPKPEAPAPQKPASKPAAADAGEREETVAMSPLRRRIAERLVMAQQSTASLTTFNEVDMSAIFAARKRYKDRFSEVHGVKLGFMSYFIKAAVAGLKEYPGVNAEIRGESITYKHHYDIGVAVGGGKGLVVPVIRDADRLSFAAIEQEIGRLAGRARDNKLTLDDLSGGTFTISNGGIYGSMLSTPILNPPQTGILGLHNIVERPVAIDGKVEIRPIMYVALTYDHRVVDGREAVLFLVRVKQCIENPERLLLEI